MDSILDADLVEIVPETPYTSDDLNYNDSSSRSSQEMNDPGAHPAISGSVEDMELYDVISLGYSIWWGEAPRIVNTFLEGYDLTMLDAMYVCRPDVDSSRPAVQDWIAGLNLDI